MISFIIIGRNIEHTIEKCLDGVYRFIQEESIPESEVIYVDSDSSDRSVDLARKSDATIVKLSGEVNAAVGRNVGAEVSSGNVLFFLDGDMELIPGFLEMALDESGNLKYPFFTGYWNEVFYDKHWNKRKTVEAKPPETSQDLAVTGGLMMVEREKWIEMNGMDDRFARSQDHDLGLRMNKIGFPVRKLPVVMVNHHTISYFEGQRIGLFFRGTGVLCQGLLMRKHLLNKAYLGRYTAKIVYAFMVIFGLGFLAFAPQVGAIIMALYLLIQMARAAKLGGSPASILRRFVFHSLFSAYAAIGFLFYYPNRPEYTFVKDSRKPQVGNSVTEQSNHEL